MCGRIAQHRALQQYMRYLASPKRLASPPSDAPIARYNVPPSTQVQIIHEHDDQLHVEPVRWGYAPFWAKGKRPPPINARLETAATSKFWKGIWCTGRCLVPADGWFEWVKDPNDPKKKQPYYIRHASDAPMLMAAIAQLPKDEDDTGGFAIITADSDQGMVDIHDRRPVVLPPDVAREWLEPGLLPERAEDLARHHAEPVEAFEWFPVDKAVGNVRNEGSHLIEREI
ncbi:Putative SOS response-associated peptidase YedK [Halopseudomonas xinjiangensis]|uniref:Abasic site processing protein n=1 Tax=Halopseudomonas xinjiangensis TaxID=487184 RepID=A0A1H1QG16_9GAMM|nr:SOS response-associated peptidase family protein [Halopseudomonas xinjiangensis]SDS22390.1 Putative SOS response-associated peptidase YedK [Halopseudomonas xinjiangensis]